MPLIQSSSKDAVGKNITEMKKSGYKNSQAIAAALAAQRAAKKKHMAEGGEVHDASEGAPEMDTGAIMEKLKAHLSPEEHAHLAKYTQAAGDAPPQSAGGWPTFPRSEAGESLSPNVQEAEAEAPEAPEADETPAETPAPAGESSREPEHGAMPSDDDFSYGAEMKRKAQEYLSDDDADNGMSLRHAELTVRKPGGGEPTLMSAGGITKPGTKEDVKTALARRKAKAALERAAYKPRES